MAAGGSRFGRRGFLKGATAVTLGSIAARGVYEVLDEAGGGPARAWAAVAVRRLQEQYLVDRIEVILDNGVTVAIPPLRNDVFTAKLNSNLTWSASALRDAQRRVESALAAVEKVPSGRCSRTRTAAPISGICSSNGINARIRASHRQNYLIPPRRHRSFPLVELLT